MLEASCINLHQIGSMVVESALIGKQVYFGQKTLHGTKLRFQSTYLLNWTGVVLLVIKMIRRAMHILTERTDDVSYNVPISFPIV